MTTSSVGDDAAAARLVGPASETVQIRRLLCAIDLSDVSATALDRAADLARACGADITALFVFPALPASAEKGASLPAPRVPDPGVRSVLAKDVEGFVRGARASGASVHARLEVGDPAAEILAAATETKADAIVMGTHGRSGIESWILGSVTQRVLRSAKCPVLTVSACAQYGSGSGPGLAGRILCAVDLADCSARTLRYALYLGRTTGCAVTLVHVIEDPWQYEAAALRARLDWGGFRRGLEEDASERLLRVLQGECECPGEVARRLTTGKPYREILRLADEEGACMIVMGMHGEAGARGGLFGSNAQNVVRAARCPVLTVRGS